MPSWSEVLGNSSIRGQNALRMPNGLQPLHETLPLARRPMRVLAPVIEIPTLTMLDPWENLALGGAVALQLVYNDDAGHVREAFEQRAKKLLRSLLIAPALYQDIAQQRLVTRTDGSLPWCCLPHIPSQVCYDGPR